tara:strand:- start:4044 stop:5483 length:1440 start_codon:yes stop_codon:yes gene_type:complete
MQIAEEAPFLFFEDIIPFSVDPDAVPTRTDDTVSVLATDHWVLQQDLTSTTTDRLVWNTTNATSRNWSGRTVSAEDADGRWHDFRIREVWIVLLGGGIYQARMSLDRPWPTNTAPTGMKYRVQTSEMALPDDTIEIRSMTLKRNQLDYPLTVIGQDRAEYASLNMADRLQSQGVPRWCFRREYQVLQAPTFDPASSASTTTAWNGLEPRGQFQYLFTYIWGQREIWYATQGPLEQTQVKPIVTPDTTNSRVEAYWESGPSNETTSFEPPEQQPGSGTYWAIDMTLPNIDFMLGFDGAGLPRRNRSGIRKRIYRRRLTDAGDKVGAGVRVETPDNFFFLDEVEGEVITYTDTGAITPDYNRPFREIHGYQTLRFTPVPDKTYPVEMRCVRTPRKLVDDKDVPRIHSDAIPTLINRTLQFVYEAMGNEAAKRSAQADYERALYNLTKRYGDARPSSRVRKKRVASVHRNLIYRRQFPLVKG